MNKNDKKSPEINVIDVDPGTLLAIVAILLFLPLVLTGLLG